MRRPIRITITLTEQRHRPYCHRRANRLDLSFLVVFVGVVWTESARSIASPLLHEEADFTANMARKG